jgi:Flp pilus assembly protein TadG
MQQDWILKLLLRLLRLLRLHRQLKRLSADTSGMVAVEFVLTLPLMLMIFFGTIQISTAVAVDRKVSITARTLSDLISQAPATGAADSDFTNAFNITQAILSPYSNTPLTAIISQIRINPTTLAGEVVWSKASNATAHTYKQIVTVPSALQIAGSYLIMSEVSYVYQPIVGYDIKLGFSSASYTLSDSMFTRPRNFTCVYYSTWQACPTTGNLP